MTRRLAPLSGALVLAGILSLAATADTLADNAGGPYNPQLVVPTPVVRAHACGIDHAVPRRRGIAILSPIESPDSWNPGVGGKTIYTSYYPDYCAHRWHGPRILVPNNSPNYAARFAGVCAPTTDATGLDGGVVDTAAYGSYSGARSDESNLLHLGGFSGAGADRTSTAPDMIDLIRSGQ